MKLTNKSIVGLLAIALLISVAGSMINVHRLGNLGGGLLTGAATDPATGTATITITSSTSLDNQVATIAFDSGFVNGSCTECQMDSNGFHNQTGSCCRDFENVSSGFLLENTGNTNMSVNYSCSGSCDASTFIGKAGSTAQFQIRVSSNSVEGQAGEAGTLDSQTSCNSTALGTGGWNISNVSSPVANDFALERTYVYVETTSWLCGNETNFPLEFNDNYDASVVDINLSIPSDAPTGSEQTATFTFTAYASG